jgi:hypothetical protein
MKGEASVSNSTGKSAVPPSDEGRDLIAKIMKQHATSKPTPLEPDAAKEGRKIRDDRHELLRDAIEDALRSAIKKIDKYELRQGNDHLSYGEVAWSLAHVIHDVLRFGPINEEPTDWGDVEEFIRKLRAMDYERRDESWLEYDPRVDSHCIPWFF